MFLGRLEELNYLDNYFKKAGSQMVVLYGRKHMGKTALIKKFVESKDYSYYLARTCSEKEQQFEWTNELMDQGFELESDADYSEILKSITGVESRKKIIVIDEFQNLVRTGESFMNALINVLHEQWNSQPVMIILSSSSLGWVENSMVTKIGKAAYEISGFLKVKELSFSYMREYFPGFTRQQCIEAYAVLGGVPGLWKYFDDSLSIKENIIKNILSPEAYLYQEGGRQVSEELRETSVYHTILTTIAAGKYKLNDLYAHTGFSRAKISVYLKNLMELEIIEKVNSFELEGKDNTQKGIYRICNHYINFWFKFLYRNCSSLAMANSEDFFTEYIEPVFKRYVASYFNKVCINYIQEQAKLMSEAAGNTLAQSSKLPFIPKKYGEWIGKSGIIDIVAEDENNQILIGACNFEKPIMDYEDYEWLIFCAKQAKVEPASIYLFSEGRFDEKLYLESKVKKSLHLVDFKEL